MVYKPFPGRYDIAMRFVMWPPHRIYNGPKTGKFRLILTTGMSVPPYSFWNFMLRQKKGTIGSLILLSSYPLISFHIHSLDYNNKTSGCPLI